MLSGLGLEGPIQKKVLARGMKLIISDVKTKFLGVKFLFSGEWTLGTPEDALLACLCTKWLRQSGGGRVVPDSAVQVNVAAIHQPGLSTTCDQTSSHILHHPAALTPCARAGGPTVRC